MSGGLNALRDVVPVSAFPPRDSEAESDDSAGADSEEPTTDLVGPDRRLRSRVTPNSKLGWVGYFAGAVLAVVVLRWLFPLIPPWFTSTPFLIGYAGLFGCIVSWLHGRKSALELLGRFEIAVFPIGEVAVAKIGRVTTTVDKDPLFEELNSLGFAALNPRFRTVDDVFQTDEALMSKLDRRKQDGSWEPARIKLDHVYQADGDAPAFDSVIVCDASGLETDSSAPEWDIRTKAPDRPNRAATRKLVQRDQVLRYQVIPSLRERLSTARGRLEALKEQQMDDPVIRLTELDELLDTLRPDHQRGVRRNGHGTGLTPQPDISDIDERVEEDIEARQEASNHE